MNKIRIKIDELLKTISMTQDLSVEKLTNHQQQVAYLSYRLAQHLKLPLEKQYDIYIAGLIHDIGALSSKERLEIVDNEPFNINNHAFRGAKLIENFKPLKNMVGMIKFHHLSWSHGAGTTYKGEDVPFECHILHLADRTCTSFNKQKNVLSQLPDVLARIEKGRDTTFHPDLVDALHELSKKEYIWLDLMSLNLSHEISDTALSKIHVLEIDDLIDLALVFSHIIDFRNNFTALHTAGVAKTAEKLAELCGFSPYECKMMLVAGYFHDLGKIAIHDDILQKPAKLNEDEFNEIRSHTYYTYRMLEPIEQLKTINEWASFHHEKLDGTGYPFHIGGDSLTLGSRIMSVADVFTAITEDRPYRKGMDFEQTKNVLYNMVRSNALDARVVEVILSNFDEVNEIRKKAQVEAEKEYHDFIRVNNEI